MKRLELPVSLAIDGEQGFGAAQIPCQKGECRHLQGRFAIDAQAAWRRRKSQAMPAALGKEIEWQGAPSGAGLTFVVAVAADQDAFPEAMFNPDAN